MGISSVKQYEMTERGCVLHALSLAATGARATPDNLSAYILLLNLTVPRIFKQSFLSFDNKKENTNLNHVKFFLRNVIIVLTRKLGTSLCEFIEIVK